jgi:NitT/TauT family transport system substrate-binding protein
MDQSSHASFTRRRFMSSSVTFAAAPLLTFTNTAAAEPPPEITTIKLEDFPAICLVPAFLAEELLYAEGFTRVEYVKGVSNVLVESDEFDLTLITAPALVNTQDTSSRWLAIAGIHSGCQELFGNDRVRTIRDLKGKSVAISAIGSGEHIFVSSVAAYVGIDPNKDINWVVANSSKAALQRFIDGKADAYWAFEPQPHVLKDKKIGHVILNTTEDKPWSQYFCCMAVARRDFVRRHPVATKRALRAFLKASDICALEPERAARYLADNGHESRYELSLDVLKALPFDRWREANPEDTLRFHALRLHEVGMIKTHPNKLIAQGTDWRFLNELKKELKA